MARVLFVVPPLTGHVNPTISVGGELARRGHEVAWAGMPVVVEDLLGPGATFFGVGAGAAGALSGLAGRRGSLRGAAALKFLWEDFIVPLARAMAPDLDGVVASYRPDVMVVDQQAPAGAVVARQHGVPWLTSATTSAELADPLAALPRVDAWARAQLAELAGELGDPNPTGGPAGASDLRFSPWGTLAFTTTALAGDAAVGGVPVHFVGPSLDDRREPTPFDWEWLDPTRPCVLVSLGTLNAEVGSRFLREAVAALAPRDLQAVVVAPDGVVDLPAGTTNVVVRPRVPQLALLEHVDAVVCHAGHNTVCEALAHGVPLVVAPIRDDQPVVADQVVRAGAGIRVKFGRVRADELGAAVDEVLTAASYRQGATRVRASFAAAGGPGAAADVVERTAPGAAGAHAGGAAP